MWEEKSLVAGSSSYKQWGRLDSRPTEKTLSLFHISSSPQSFLCHLRCVWLAGALAFDPAVAELGQGDLKVDVSLGAMLVRSEIHLGSKLMSRTLE